MADRQSETTFDCPRCGEPTETLHEGYCEPCREEGQRSLDAHNARFDWWQGLTPVERDTAIKEAMRHG